MMLVGAELKSQVVPLWDIFKDIIKSPLGDIGAKGNGINNFTS